MRATIEEACRLMAQTALSLKEVATCCGFHGFSEFHRAFKQHTGQSPSHWRSNRLYRGLGFRSKTPFSEGKHRPPVQRAQSWSARDRASHAAISESPRTA
jgi:AraC-like DNA-binding protein